MLQEISFSMDQSPVCPLVFPNFNDDDDDTHWLFVQLLLFLFLSFVSGDASAEGVQRDLLPLAEGSTVSTKHGNVNTDYILFICSGVRDVCPVVRQMTHG